MLRVSCYKTPVPTQPSSADRRPGALVHSLLAVVCWLLGVGVATAHQQATQPQPGPPPLSTELPPLPSIDPSLPTLFLIGDSTVKVGTAGQMGWGEAIGDLFDRSRINVVNYARGGRSSRTFLTEGLWNRVLSALRPGDFVVIQFGHNDGGELFATTRPRGSLAGVGDETRADTVAMTGQFEVVRTFGWYIKRYVSDARERGATPIVCSLIPRRIWRDDRIVRDERADWAQDAARASGAVFMDLNTIIARRYEAMGPDAVLKLFADEHTHTNPDGARLNADSVVAGLRDIQSPLVRYLLAR
jgi:rhamnogalacturonan acetylesterase